MKSKEKDDLRLRKDVDDELLAEPSLDASQIGVTVKDGVVTLTGDVSGYAQKWSAERAVKRVAGVKGYAEEIQVRLPGSAERSDADIARAAVNALDWNTALPPGRVKVKVQNGGLTLEGEVDWRFQSEAAQDAVRYLTGVKWVDNQIIVRPSVSASEVKRKIQDSLTRSALLDAGGITVRVKNDSVTLEGSVRSWVERDEAERAAWAIPGVAHVHDRLDIN